MVRFQDVVEVNATTRLDYGKHLVKVAEARNTNKDGEELLDSNGVEQWSVTFEDKSGARHYEYFQFSGKMANKTGYFLRAVGLLDPDEKITETKKDFKPDDVVGSYLYIEIVENKNAKDEKYRKQIAFNGFEKYEKQQAKKVEAKKVEVIDEETLPF